MNGIFVLGGAGEGPWLTASQQREVVEYTSRTVSGRIPVIVGVLEPSTNRSLEAIRMVESAGADAIAVTSPYYFSADGAVQIHHFEAIAATTSLPIMLYNIPSKTHNPLAPQTIQRLLEIDSLLMIKDSTGDWEGFQHVLAARASRPDVRVFQGSERLALRSILEGADGLLTGLANLAPGLFTHLIKTARAGDTEVAESLQLRIESLCELYRAGFWVESLKYAVSL